MDALFMGLRERSSVDRLVDASEPSLTNHVETIHNVQTTLTWQPAQHRGAYGG